MAEKIRFGSKIGLVAATVGSAVGLGNIWRFPAEAQSNGGSAFLLVYVVCVLLLGIPVMLGEFSLGRAGRSDAIGVYKKLSPGKPWWMVGGLSILASYIILCFYMVIAGITFEYLLQSISGNLYEGITIDGAKQGFAEKMQEYVCGSWGPLVNTYIMIAINLGVLVCGVKKGIERMSNLLMPLLFVLLVIFCWVSLSLPGATEGLNMFFNPDFSKITPTVVINALGQAFFSLSLGMGILITYSSYFPKDTKLTKTATTVSLLDMLVAVMMGVVIFPAIVSFGLTGESLEGQALVFVTLPEVFEQMPGTQLWSILFFILLTVAALTSTVSISEVTIAFFRDRFGMSRFKACLIVMLPLFLFSSICSLSLGPWKDIHIFGMDIFSLLDTVATNIMLPLGAMIMCVYLGWFAPKGLLSDQLTNQQTVKDRFIGVIMFIIKWIAPPAIAIIFISQFIK